nr:unnamed protein product [Callosobruchus chinensis]
MTRNIPLPLFRSGFKRPISRFFSCQHNHQTSTPLRTFGNRMNEVFGLQNLRINNLKLIRLMKYGQIYSPKVSFFNAASLSKSCSQ